MVRVTCCITLLFFTFIHGNQNEVMEFLKQINFKHLDLIQFHSITFNLKEMSDENLFIFVEQVQNQTKPFSIKKQNDCNGSNLNVILDESEIISKTENCSQVIFNKGRKRDTPRYF